MNSLPIRTTLNARKLWAMYSLLALIAFFTPFLLGLAFSSREHMPGVLALSIFVGVGPLVGGLIRHLRGPHAIEVHPDRLVLTYRSRARELPFSELQRIRISGNPGGGIGFRTRQELIVFNVDSGRGTPVAEALVAAVSQWSRDYLGPEGVLIRDLRVLGPPDLEIVLPPPSRSVHRASLGLP